MTSQPATTPTVEADCYWAQIPEWLLDTASPRALQVYGFLRRYADKGNGTSFPLRATLAKRAKCSPPTIDRATDELVKLGALIIKPRWVDVVTDDVVFVRIKKRKYRQTSNHYTTLSMRRGTPMNEQHPLFIDDEGGTPMNDEHNQSHYEPESLEPELALRATNGHDTMVFALANAMGWQHRDITEPQWGKLHAAAKHLTDIDADPREVPRRAQVYRVNLNGATMTPNAIATNWADLAEARPPISARDVERAAKAAARRDALASIGGDE